MQRARADVKVRAPMARPDLQDAPPVRLLPGRDKRVKAGHPWAFSNEIAMTAAAKALPPGSPVRLEATTACGTACGTSTHTA